MRRSRIKLTGGSCCPFCVCFRGGFKKWKVPSKKVCEVLRFGGDNPPGLECESSLIEHDMVSAVHAIPPAPIGVARPSTFRSREVYSQ